MSTLDFIKERKSIRKYKNALINKSDIETIIDAVRFAPSWANTQTARYTIVQDKVIIKKICESGVNNFAYNMNTLVNATNVAVLSYVQGKSGKLKGSDEFATNKENSWEIFDAGISCQTFCLAANAIGIGTCIMGIINDIEIAKIINLPQNETVAALIVFGIPDESPEKKPRLAADEIHRII